MAWRKLERGDTLVEVLLSMAILSLVIVGGSVLMNFGLLSVQNATEHTQVRNLVAGQSEVLHYLRSTAQRGETDPISTVWDALLEEDNGYITNEAASLVENCAPPSGGKKEFFLETVFNGDDVLPTITVKDYPADVSGDPRQYAIPGRGLWIEAVKPATLPPDAPEYVNFHIRSCWLGIGTGATQQQYNTVVRLFIQ